MEIVVYPECLQEIERVQLFGLADLKSQFNPREILEPYQFYLGQLRKEYFYRPQGIHGLMHTRRVLLLNIIIGLLQGCSEKQLNILCTAALYHDIGRINDNVDPQHGRESFRKAEDLGVLTGLDSSEGQILKYIIENHCISDRQARELLPDYGLSDQKEVQYLFNIFKDADGLDRVRINDLDSRQLRTEAGKKLILLARELYHNFDSLGLE
jgi:hypothetical protein